MVTRSVLEVQMAHNQEDTKTLFKESKAVTVTGWARIVGIGEWVASNIFDVIIEASSRDVGALRLTTMRATEEDINRVKPGTFDE